MNYVFQSFAPFFVWWEEEGGEATLPRRPRLFYTPLSLLIIVSITHPSLLPSPSLPPLSLFSVFPLGSSQVTLYPLLYSPPTTPSSHSIFSSGSFSLFQSYVVKTNNYLHYPSFLFSFRSVTTFFFVATA